MPHREIRPSYIPFDGDEFLKPIDGCAPATIAGALRLSWHYWNATGCAGLRDDRSWLQRVARLNDDEWAVAERDLFGDFFEQNSLGLWHHAGLRRLWLASCERIKIASERGKSAACRRWGK